MTDTERTIYLGQRLGVGFDGPTIPEEYIQMVKKFKIGNVILFRRNVVSYDQLKKLCRDLRDLILAETGLPPFIMIDEECGSVSRLGHIAVPTPSAMAIGATKDPSNANAIGRLIGEELASVGINFNLAPVLDCYTNPDNNVCGNRCFSNDPEKVSIYGNAYIQGLSEAGIIACGKHFPGHGDTDVDSHLALPIVNKTVEEMRKTELVPFRAAIRSGIPSIMSAHVVFPAMDPANVPSTVSRKVMTGLLRNEMGFGGIIVSDAMEMKAVLDLYGIEKGTLMALQAGIDVALICHSVEQASAASCTLLDAVHSGILPEDNLMDSYERIVRVKGQLHPAEKTAADFGNAEQKKVAEKIMTDAVSVIHVPDGEPWPTLDSNTLFFGTKARRNALVNDDIPLDAAAECAEFFSGRNGGATPEENPEKAIVFLGRHPEQQATLDAAHRMAESGTKLIAVSMYTPRCLDFLPDSVFKICIWQYDELAIQAFIRKWQILSA